MKEPCISVDRSRRKIAIFDGLQSIGGFKPYTDEDAAVAEARAEIAKHTDAEPEMVYPRVTSVTFSSRRVKVRA